jgi:hypothetical protein
VNHRAAASTDGAGSHLHDRIAGVDYLVTYSGGVVMRAAGPISAEFSGHPPLGSDVITINLIVGQLPEISWWRTLVTSGPVWSIRQNAAQRGLCLGAPGAGRPGSLVACWPDNACCATVYCGSEFVSSRGSGLRISNTAGYPVDQLLLMYYLASRQGLLVHAAGLVMDGRALIFPGISGAGKSTLMRQFLQRGCSGLLSDDRVIVRTIAGCYQAFGTPWPGDAGVVRNSGAPLAAILFPAKAAHNHITRLHARDALARLLPATSVLWHEQELLTGQLETCTHLLSSIPAFELSWSLGSAVVDNLQAFMRQL